MNRPDTGTRSYIQFTKIFFILPFLILLSNCGEKPLTNVEYGNKHGILFIANGEEPKGLDPQLTTGDPDRNVILGLFEGLVRLNPKTLHPEPGVAESWTISEDGTTYVFNIRKN